MKGKSYKRPNVFEFSDNWVPCVSLYTQNSILSTEASYPKETNTEVGSSSRIWQGSGHILILLSPIMNSDL